MENIKKRLGNLLSVKSIVTLVLTAVFAYMAVAGKISQDFMMVYTVVIAFYFGTQSQKAQDAEPAAIVPVGDIQLPAGLIAGLLIAAARLAETGLSDFDAHFCASSFVALSIASCAFWLCVPK